jgi:membrane-associated phospholipid phosphatase
VLLPLGLSSCEFGRQHVEGQPWRNGIDEFREKPEQWVPAAVTLAATPVLFIVDKSTSAESVEDQYFNTNTTYGDELALGLGLAPIALGGVMGLTTGDTRYLEVSSEAVVLTVAETQLLKVGINRRRPNGTSGSDSFPSGHTSFAFCGATLLARWWEQEHDGSLWGYLLYVPASYVGLTRLEGDRHFLSDVTFGATLGIVTSNLLWNVHFGDDAHEGIFGRRADVRLDPVISDQGLGLGLTISY